MPEERKHCRALTRRGTPCGVWTLKGEEHCLFHSQSLRAAALRKKAQQAAQGHFVTRRQLLLQLSKDFHALIGREDATSRRERQRLGSLIHELLKEREQLNKIRRLAQEKGLL